MVTHSLELRLTYDDYCLIPHDGKRHEIIEGEHAMSPAPRIFHQQIVLELGRLLGNHLALSHEGKVFIAPVDVILSDSSVVQPDVLFVSTERAHLIEDHAIVGAPDWVIEVLSEGNRRHDEIVKRKLYAQHGVAEYWIVDPALGTIKVYRITETGYTRIVEWRAEVHDTATTPLLQGFTLALPALFGKSSA